MSFEELNDYVAAAIQRLSSLGVKPGDRVMLLGANSIEWVVVFWACLAAGWVAVPANAWWSTEEVHRAVATVDPLLAVVDEPRRGRLPDGLATVAFEDIRSTLDSGKVGGGKPDLYPTEEDESALILFTSGTTSVAKGATLTHRNLIGSLQSVLVATGQLRPDGAIDGRPRASLLSVPLFHIGAIQQLLLSMVTGGTLVFLQGRFDPAEVLRLIERERVVAWSAVPTMVSRVVDDLSNEPEGTYDVSSLRSLGMGAAAASPALQARVGEAFPQVVAGLGVSYGLTEAAGVVAMAAGATLRDHVGTVGRVLPTVDVKIEDPDELGSGEILVRSPGVMRGYWGETDNVSIDADRWLRTGDSGRLDSEGFLYLSGRVKDIVIRGGENVSCASVEARLLQHPAVSEVAVVGLPHPDLGEEVAAAVVLRRGQTASAQEMANFASETLSYYKVPTRWWLGSDELPKTASGKIVKRDVVAIHFGRPTPSGEGHASSA